MASPVPAIRASWRGCWDCEGRLSAREVATGATYCTSCERHRVDGHPPIPLIVTDDEYGPIGKTYAAYCHGAGPSGINYALLNHYPEPIVVDNRGADKNPHTYRVAAWAAGERGAA